jgi:hypothetical protein
MALNQKLSGAEVAAGIVVAGLGIALAAYCSNQATAPPQPAPVSASPEQPARASPTDLTPDEVKACQAYGTVAGNLATDRDNGIPLSAQLSDIQTKMGTTPAANEITQLARLLYTHPYFKKLTPEGAAPVFDMDCTMRVQKMKGGSNVYNTRADIASSLAQFKTFNGKPLVDLLAGYGVKIDSAEATPTEAFGDGQGKPGDIVFTLTFSKPPTKMMPCRLNKWLSGEVLPIPEFTRSVSEFPEIKPDTDDPLIYWAATGKCSTAYSY